MGIRRRRVLKMKPIKPSDIKLGLEEKGIKLSSLKFMSLNKEGMDIYIKKVLERKLRVA